MAGPLLLPLLLPVLLPVLLPLLVGEKDKSLDLELGLEFELELLLEFELVIELELSLEPVLELSPTLGLWSPSSDQAGSCEAVKAQAHKSDSDTAFDISKLSAGFWPLNCTKCASLSVPRVDAFPKRHSNLNTSGIP
jgi:hypothetical protein